MSGAAVTQAEGTQDFATYGASVVDPVTGYLSLEVMIGSMKLVKTSENGKVGGISFTITGEGVNTTKTTDANGVIDISDLNPGVYTVAEQAIDKYEPQETRRVTVVSGQTATVNFNNTLKRGDLKVTKTSEDGLVEGMTFHLFGTSLSGIAVDEYAVTNANGVASFNGVLIGSGYTLEEIDTPIRYVVPDSQTVAINWNDVTQQTVNNILKKFRVTLTKGSRDRASAGVTPRLPVRPTVCIRAIRSSTAIPPMQTGSLPRTTMSAMMTGASVRSTLPRGICWTAAAIMWAQSLSSTPLS